MAPPDLDKLDKLHDQLNRKLLSWEKSKLADLVRSFRQAEAEIKVALLNSAEAWEQMRLEGLLAEINRIMDQLDTVGVQWVKGRNDVPLENPQAGLAPYPALLGGKTGMASVAIAAGSFSAIHLPVLTYLQDYDLSLIRSVTNQVRDEVKSELKQALIAGDSIPEAAKRLRNTRLGKGIWPSIEKRAEVIARTEILRASNQGALAVYKQYDVRRVKWLTAADERVCQVCGPLHGKLFPIGQLPFGGPPAHPRCRCFIAGDIATSDEEGNARDLAATGNAKQFKQQNNIRVPKSLGASAKRIHVKNKIPISFKKPAYIKEGSYISGVKSIAEGEKIRDVSRLVEQYRLQDGSKTSPIDWKKMRGTAIITRGDQDYKAEIHWYEAKNIGKVEWKVKKEFNR